MIAIDTINYLPKGYYSTKSISTALDYISGLASGDYYVGVFFDDEFSITETNEEDNTGYFTSSLNIYTGIDDNNLSNKNTLLQNYPNPFNLFTNIKFSISKKTHVVLNIYNINGKLIQTLINQDKTHGSYIVKWDATNIPAGIYVYQFKAGDFNDVRRCIVVK